MKSRKDLTESKTKRPPARTPEADEKQLISLATDLARKQLSEGTASSQVITHYLKLGTTIAKLEQENLREEIQLRKAKTESLRANQRMETLYDEAIRAMRTYNGSLGEHSND